MINIPYHTFVVNQLISLIVTDASTLYTWGASYRVLDVSGTTHTLDNQVPQFLLDASARYTIRAKYAYSSFADFTMDVKSANEVNNYFNIYLNTDYRQHFLDSTFATINILFDHDYVNEQWYDSSVNSVFYYYNSPITVDVSTLVIIKTQFDVSTYDSSTYLLNQKNMWTLKENISKNTIFKVFNESVPFIFDTSGYYDVEIESYDSYGNLASKTYEGLINVI